MNLDFLLASNPAIPVNIAKGDEMAGSAAHVSRPRTIDCRDSPTVRHCKFWYLVRPTNRPGFRICIALSHADKLFKALECPQCPSVLCIQSQDTNPLVFLVIHSDWHHHRET